MKMTITAMVAAGAISAMLGAPAVAMAAPSGTGSALDTAGALEDSGYQGSTDKIGPTPLEQCAVDWRPGHRVFGDPSNRTAFQPVSLTARC